MPVVSRVFRITLLLLTLGSSFASAQSVTLTWDRNPEPEVTGYRIYYGTESLNYPFAVDAGNQTTFTVNGLDVSKDYYFAVRAYNSVGMMSPLSAEVNQPAIVPPGTTTISGLTSSLVSPFLSGTPVRWTAAATSKKGPVEYKFWMYSAAGGWTVAQDYSQTATLDWTPTFEDVGTHTIQVWARTVGSPASYEAWIGSTFEVTASPVALTADVEFPTPPGQPVRWTASIAGANGPLEYSFWLLDRATGTWSQLRAYGTSNQVTWTPSAVGSFNVQVWARRVGSTQAYQVWGGTGVLTVSRTPLTLLGLTADTSLPAMTGTTITWTARAKGGMAGPIEYVFYRFSAAKNAWVIARNYSPSNSFTWTPAMGEQGTYALQVWARSAGSTAAYDAWLGTGLFEIRQAPIEISADTVFPVPPNTSVKWTATIAGSPSNVEYAYYLYNRGTGTWAPARAYSTDNTFTWTPTAVGTYLFQVWARRVGSTAAYDVWRGTDYLEVVSTPASVVSLTPNVPLPASVGTAITWTAVAKGGTAAPLQYRFYLYTEGQGFTMLRDYSTNNAITWTPGPTDTGAHSIQVWVRSAGSTATYEGWLGLPLFMINP